MKKVFVLLVFLLFTAGVFAQDQDPAYMKAFGYGVVMASNNGFPAYKLYDPAQFDYRDKVFHAKAEATLSCRVILPEGTTFATYMQKLKTQQSKNLKYKTSESHGWRIWCSNNNNGELLVSEKYPWPAKVGDEPKWAEPVAEQFYEETAENSSWSTAALKWEDIKFNLNYYFKKGNKLFIAFYSVIEYKVPGGEMETKWNDKLNIWEDVVSTGAIGYIYSDPIASCTVVIE